MNLPGLALIAYSLAATDRNLSFVVCCGICDATHCGRCPTGIVAPLATSRPFICELLRTLDAGIAVKHAALAGTRLPIHFRPRGDRHNLAFVVCRGNCDATRCVALAGVLEKGDQA